MDNKIRKLLSSWSQVDFGAVNLSREEKAFCRELNREMLLLCEYLPKSMRTNAALFLVRYLQASFSDGLRFVNYFYAPAWSILFWLHQSCPGRRRLDPKCLKDAKIGHIVAMFLHALDDHLTDGQLPVTHLSLLMRSQFWMIMNQAYRRLAKGVEKGAAIVRGFIEDYYSSIGKYNETESMDHYCKSFTKQMGTSLIVPILLARRLRADEEYSDSIQSAYSSFGIAWRLLDDLQDIENDMMKGVHSSIYVCLNDDLRGWWDKTSEEKTNHNNDYVQSILSYVLEERVMDRIRERVCRELQSAASTADSCSMPGFARELRCLLKPLRNG